MSEPLKGVFWIIEGKILAIPYNKNFSYGVSRSGDTYVHKKIWNFVRPKGCKKTYNYYPRGRVEIKRNGKSVIFLNPRIDDTYIDNIKTVFCLMDEPKVIYDYSNHYKCYLDEGWEEEC